MIRPGDPLSARELQVLQLLARMDSTSMVKHVANQLGLSPDTVRTHLRHLSVKTRTNGRYELLSWWRRRQSAA